VERAASRRAWGAVGVWWLAMLLVTSVPGDMVPALPDFGFRIDRVVHFGMYAVQGVLVARALGRRHVGVLIAAGLVLSAIGALDEVHQMFLPGRDAEVGDWMADTLGAGAGLAAATLAMRTRLSSWLA
jgi:VanZ family protein